MRSKVLDEAARVLQCLGRVDVELRADFLLDDALERGLPVGRLPDRRGRLAQGEQSGIFGGHDNHRGPQPAGGDGGTAGDVLAGHTIISQTRASGAKTSREMGARSTNSQADWNTSFTISRSWAKNRIFCMSAEIASSCPRGNLGAHAKY